MENKIGCEENGFCVFVNDMRIARGQRTWKAGIVETASYKKVIAHMLLQPSTAQEKLYNGLNYYLVTLHDNIEER